MFQWIMILVIKCVCKYIYIYACVFYQSIPIVLPKFQLQTTWIMIARLTNEQCSKQLTCVLNTAQMPHDFN